MSAPRLPDHSRLSYRAQDSSITCMTDLIVREGFSELLAEDRARLLNGIHLVLQLDGGRGSDWGRGGEGIGEV